MISAFGVEHSDPVGKGLWTEAAHKRDGDGKFSRVETTIKEHPEAATAIGAVTVLGGVKGGSIARRGLTLRRLRDTERTSKLVWEMAGHRSARTETPQFNFDSPFDVFRAQQAAQTMRRAQYKNYLSNVWANHDVGPLGPVAHNWSAKFQDAGKIKQAAAQNTRLKPADVLRPKHVKHVQDARILTRLLAQADPKNTPRLYRGMHTYGHQPGDIIDMGPLASWTTDEQTARSITQTHQTFANIGEAMPPWLRRASGLHDMQAGGIPALYVVEPRSMPAVNISGAARKHVMNEWVAGGKFRVVRVEGHLGNRIYHLEPVSTVQKGMLMLSGFGVEHGGAIAKRSNDQALLRRHGLRGAPQGVDRDTRQAIWEARARHLNRKRDRWDKGAKGARAVETTGGAVAGGVGALIVGHQLRESMSPEGKAALAGKVNAGVLRAGLRSARAGNYAAKAGRVIVSGRPGFKTIATGAVAGTSAAAARRARIIAQKKVRRYSSASGGIAAGAASRMRDYDLNKSEPGAAMHAHDLEVTKLYTESRDATLEQVKAAYPKKKGLHPISNFKAGRKVKQAERGKPFKQFRTDEMTEPMIVEGRADDGRLGPTKVIPQGQKGLLLKRASKTTPDALARQKKVQGALGATAAATGLAALGTKTGGKLLPKLIKETSATGKAATYQRHLDKTADALLFGASGVGGASGLHQSAIYRHEAKAEKPKQGVIKALNVPNEGRALRLAFTGTKQDTRIRASNLVMRSWAHGNGEGKAAPAYMARQKRKVATAIERASKGEKWSPVKRDKLIKSEVAKRGRRTARFIGNIAEEAASRAAKGAQPHVDEAVNHATRKLRGAAVAGGIAAGITGGVAASAGGYYGARRQNHENNKKLKPLAKAYTPHDPEAKRQRRTERYRRALTPTLSAGAVGAGAMAARPRNHRKVKEYQAAAKDANRDAVARVHQGISELSYTRNYKGSQRAVAAEKAAESIVSGLKAGGSARANASAARALRVSPRSRVGWGVTAGALGTGAVVSHVKREKIKARVQESTKPYAGRYS